MNFDYAVAAADIAARALFRPPEEAPPWWTDVADRPLSQADLGRWVEQHPGEPAEALYRFVAGRKASAAGWCRLSPQMRSAFEIFRASCCALLVLVREAERQAAETDYRPRERPRKTETAAQPPAAFNLPEPQATDGWR